MTFLSFPQETHSSPDYSPISMGKTVELLFMRHSISMMEPRERRLAAPPGRLVFLMTELSGSIWLTEAR